MNYLYKAQTDFDMSIGAHNFFQSFFMTITKNGLIGNQDIEHINQEIMAMLERGLRLHTRSVNSSVPTQVAQHVMQSNLYAVSYYLKQFSFDDCITLITDTPLSSLLDKGKKQIREDVEKAKYLLYTIRDNRIKTKNHAYNDTLGHGIGMFFSNYNVDEKAHETPGSIDYPIYGTETGLVGIEYMTRYLKLLYYEVIFCKNFSQYDIEAILFNYNNKYPDLLINIFEQVLTNIAGNILAGNSHSELNISKNDIIFLYNKLRSMSPLRLSLEMTNTTTKIINAYNIKSQEFTKHINSIIQDLSRNISVALQHKTLNKLFITI